MCAGKHVALHSHTTRGRNERVASMFGTRNTQGTQPEQNTEQTEDQNVFSQALADFRNSALGEAAANIGATTYNHIRETAENIAAYFQPETADEMYATDGDVSDIISEFDFGPYEEGEITENMSPLDFGPYEEGEIISGSQGETYGMSSDNMPMNNSTEMYTNQDSGGPTYPGVPDLTDDQRQKIVDLVNKTFEKAGQVSRCSINSSDAELENAIRGMQRLTGVTDDGMVGPETLAAVNRYVGTSTGMESPGMGSSTATTTAVTATVNEPGIVHQGNVVSPEAFAGQVFGDHNSPVARSVGAAEGTRNPQTGEPTEAFYGHPDPGDGLWNLGTFSYSPERNGVPAGTPEEADVLYQQVLRERYDEMVGIFQREFDGSGHAITSEMIMNGIDLANQAPAAALNDRGYVERLKEYLDAGHTGQEAIIGARVDSYLDPSEPSFTGQRFLAGGLTHGAPVGEQRPLVERDQARRAGEIEVALNSLSDSGSYASQLVDVGSGYQPVASGTPTENPSISSGATLDDPTVEDPTVEDPTVEDPATDQSASMATSLPLDDPRAQFISNSYNSGHTFTGYERGIERSAISDLASAAFEKAGQISRFDQYTTDELLTNGIRGLQRLVGVPDTGIADKETFRAAAKYLYGIDLGGGNTSSGMGTMTETPTGDAGATAGAAMGASTGGTVGTVAGGTGAAIGAAMGGMLGTVASTAPTAGVVGTGPSVDEMRSRGALGTITYEEALALEQNSAMEATAAAANNELLNGSPKFTGYCAKWTVAQVLDTMPDKVGRLQGSEYWGGGIPDAISAGRALMESEDYIEVAPPAGQTFLTAEQIRNLPEGAIVVYQRVGDTVAEDYTSASYYGHIGILADGTVVSDGFTPGVINVYGAEDELTGAKAFIPLPV
jgi:hypothetical protein